MIIEKLFVHYSLYILNRNQSYKAHANFPRDRLNLSVLRKDDQPKVLKTLHFSKLFFH